MKQRVFDLFPWFFDLLKKGDSMFTLVLVMFLVGGGGNYNPNNVSIHTQSIGGFSTLGSCTVAGNQAVQVFQENNDSNHKWWKLYSKYSCLPMGDSVENTKTTKTPKTK